MRIFSKFVFICNLCFVVTVVMSIIEKIDRAKGKTDVAIPLPFVHGTLVVLGFLAIVVNGLFCIIMAGFLATKRAKQIPTWLVIINFIALLAEIYWYIL